MKWSMGEEIFIFFSFLQAKHQYNVFSSKRIRIQKCFRALDRDDYRRMKRLSFNAICGRSCFPNPIFLQLCLSKHARALIDNKNMLRKYLRSFSEAAELRPNRIQSVTTIRTVCCSTSLTLVCLHSTYKYIECN